MLRLDKSGTLLDEEGGDLLKRYLLLLLLLLLGDDTSPFSNVGISCLRLCTS